MFQSSELQGRTWVGIWLTEKYKAYYIVGAILKETNLICCRIRPVEEARVRKEAFLECLRHVLRECKERNLNGIHFMVQEGQGHRWADLGRDKDEQNIT